MPNGNIKMHIFVDRTSVEVYGNDGEVVGTSLIFPDRDSNKMTVYSISGNTKANIIYYPLKKINIDNSNNQYKDNS